MNKLFFLGCMAALTAVATPAAALTVGNADGGNCYPFSCGASDGVTQYQEVYMASAFPGALSFNSVSFGQNIAGQMDSATYGVSFYLTSADVNTLSSDLGSNEGALLGTLGTFTLGGSMPTVLTLKGNNISYDPTMGNLLMNVVITNLTASNGYQSFFNADFTGTNVARAWNSSEYGDYGPATGALQTTFGAVPEPSTWVLMLLGFAGLGYAGHRRAKFGRAVPAA
jgi:hypothetical protein